MKNPPELSIILPCQNEQAALKESITTIQAVLQKNHIQGEIIVSDSSTDHSPQIAKACGAKLISHGKNGYGRAYLEAFKYAHGVYIFCADPDGSYDFNEIPRCIKLLKQGYDLVIGNRFSGQIQPQAMPFLNRYLGNPFLSYITNMLLQTKIKDTHSGLRAFHRNILPIMNLKSDGMEFATEMLLEADLHQLKISEVPIAYYKRKGSSKLQPITDGLRHLKLLFYYGVTSTSQSLTLKTNQTSFYQHASE